VAARPQRHGRLTSDNTATISRHDFCSLCRQSWHCWAARSCLTANRSNQPQPHLREVEKPGPAALIRSAARDLRATSGIQSVTRRNFTGRHSRLPFATRQPTSRKATFSSLEAILRRTKTVLSLMDDQMGGVMSAISPKRPCRFAPVNVYFEG